MKNILLLIIYLIVFGIFYNNLLFFESNLGKGIICMIMLILFFIDIKIGIAIFITIMIIYSYEYRTLVIHSYIINLDKNVNRFTGAKTQYESSDMNGIVPMDRFSGINGKKLILDQILEDDVVKDIEEVERNKSRTHHHQLTKGAVGCFMSHLLLYQQLLDDKSYNAYLIMEDDINIIPDMKVHIDYSLENIPFDWDIILYSWLRLGSQPTVFNAIDKVDYFWGMQCYLINRRGAKKIVTEVLNQPIDGQIDSYLSRMIQQGKLVVYVYNKKIVNENSNQTDIQIDMNYSKDIDPFDYKGYVLR